MIRLLTFFAFCQSALAVDYYVRTDGNDGNAGTTNSAGGAWLTIDHAADTVAAGDTIRIQAGTYAETVTPGVNGTSGNLITFVADGAVTVDNINITTGSHLRFVGLTIDADTTGGKENGCVQLNGDGTTSSFLEFWGNTFRDGDFGGIRINGTHQMDNGIIVGNTFTTFGVGNGSGVAINVYGDDNLVAHNTVTDAHPDGIAIKGDRNRLLNFYAYAFSEASGGHADLLQYGSSTTQGLEGSLMEGWFYVGTPSDADNHLVQISNGQTAGATVNNNVLRNIVTHGTGSGHGANQASAGDITHTIIYNTTEVETQRGYPNNLYGWVMISAGVNNSSFLNNLLYETWGTSATTNIEGAFSQDAAWLAFDYNLGYDPDGAVTFSTAWTDQANEQSNADPDFDDVANDDFTLGATSNATGNAGPLTLVNEAVDTTGATFTVDNGNVFRGDNTAINQYGGNLVVGDTITIGTDVREIVSISGNDITVDSSLTWANNDPVYWGDDATPDIGAYPYRSGASYTLTGTYTNDGNSYTVTPSDDELVRWLVWYEDGIPQEVDNAAPWTYTSSGGTVVPKLHAMFASKSPVVDATDANVTGTAAATSATAGSLTVD